MAANKVTVSTPGPAGEAGVNFKGNWVADTQYFTRDVVRYLPDGNLYSCIATVPTNEEDPEAYASPINPNFWILFLPTYISDSREWASTAQYTVVADDIGNTGYSALHQALQAKEWASLTGTQVRNDTDTADVDYSAKEYAIGTTVPEGSAKEWATTAEDTEVTTGLYSSLHYAAKSSASATASASSASAAATSETNAAASESAAATSETNAAASEAAAATSETNAATSETNAATSETNAATSATNSANSASAAATSESNAATSETNAANSASAASTSEANASTSEGEASDSALEALSYATEFSAVVKTYSGGVGSDVADTYSSKEWAIGTTVPDGSSKEWSTSTTEVAGGLKGAKGYAEDAAQSAVEAAAATNIEGTSITFAIALG